MEMTVAAGSELLSFATWAHGVSEKGMASSLSAALVCDTPGITGGRLSAVKLDDDLDVSEGGGEMRPLSWMASDHHPLYILC